MNRLQLSRTQQTISLVSQLAQQTIHSFTNKTNLNFYKSYINRILYAYGIHQRFAPHAYTIYFHKFALQTQ